MFHFSCGSPSTSHYIGKSSRLVFHNSHQIAHKGHPIIYSGWGTEAMGLADLTPIPPVHALLAQIDLASKSALDNDQGWHPLDHKSMSPPVGPVSLGLWLGRCLQHRCPPCSTHEVGQQSFLQVIYKAHHYVCSPYLTTVIIQLHFNITS